MSLSDPEVSKEEILVVGSYASIFPANRWIYEWNLDYSDIHRQKYAVFCQWKEPYLSSVRKDAWTCGILRTVSSRYELNHRIYPDRLGSSGGAFLPQFKVRACLQLRPSLFELHNTQMVHLNVKLLAARTEVYYSQGGGARYLYPKRVWTPAGLYIEQFSMVQCS